MEAVSVPSSLVLKSGFPEREGLAAPEHAATPETAGFARWKLVSGPVLDGETPVCAALSLLVKFRFPATFECPTETGSSPTSLAVCDVSETGSYYCVPGTQFEFSQVHHALFRT